MDPLSISGAASSLVYTVVRTGRDLATVFEKYQDSQRCVFLMQTEFTVLAATLSQLQAYFSTLPQSTMNLYSSQVIDAIDLSITGCTLTLSVLGKEINELVGSLGDSPSQMSKRKKIKYLWKDEYMQRLLQQMHGQSAALNLLLKALDSVSANQASSVVHSGHEIFESVRSDSASIRQEHPNEGYAESIVDMNLDDTKTIYSLENVETTTKSSTGVATQLGNIALTPDTVPSTGLLDEAGDNFDPAPWKVNTDRKFEAALERLRTKANIPALAVGIVSVASPPKIRVMGFRKTDCTIPATRHDCFSIANTEMYVATVLAILVERGVMRWEETIPELFPSLRSRMHPSHFHTTLQMLGAHFSGMTTRLLDAENGDLFEYSRHIGAHEGRSAIALSYLQRPCDITPGQYGWSNANAALVVLAIEDRTSESMQSLTKRLLFDPLGMRSAGFGSADAARNASQPGNPTQPWGHWGSAQGPMHPIDPEFLYSPAEDAFLGTFCSATDFASFVEMQLRNAMGLRTQCLRNPAISCTRRMPNTNVAVAHRSIRPNEQAGGEMFEDLDRSRGFSYYCNIRPTEGKAFFALANLNSASVFDALGRALKTAYNYTTTESQGR